MPVPTCTLVGCNLQTPIIDAEGCAPDGIDGEITALYFTDTIPADNTAFDNPDNTVAGGMKRLPVTGSLNASEQGTIEAEGGVTLRSKNKTRSASMTFYNLSDNQWELVRSLECGKPLYTYLEIGNQYILGGYDEFLNGISTVVTPDIVSDGAGSFLRCDLNMSWKSTYSPLRILKP